MRQFLPTHLRRISLLSGAVLVAPLCAQALTFAGIRATIALVLYGVIGFFGTLGVGLFIAGFFVYAVRQGVERRAEGITLMVWSVTVMFVVAILAVLLGIVE
jgi:hypothetical protein